MTTPIELAAGTWTRLPFMPLATLVERAGGDAVHDLQILVTDEGEYAIVVTVVRRGAPAVIGVVYGDATLDATLAPTTRDVCEHALGLPVRPRRYLHTPPEGWQWRGDHRVAIYEAPEGDAALAVYPTMPDAGVDDAWADVTAKLAARGAQIQVAFDGVEIRVGALSGRMRELSGTLASGEPARWAFAALSDGVNTYPLLMTAPESLDRRLGDFARVVESVVRLPLAVPRTFEHWAY